LDLHSELVLTLLISGSSSKEKEEIQSPIIGVLSINPHISPSSYSKSF
jgi:hypothetical protein